MGRAGISWVLSGILVALLVPGAAAAAPRYSATALGPPGFTWLTGVSNSGVVAGTIFDLSAHGTATTWQGGVATALPQLPGGLDARANAISPSGEFIVGEDLIGQNFHAVLWHNGVATDLGFLPGGGFSGAEAVNDYGVVVGVSGTANCPPAQDCSHAVVWGRLGLIHDLGALRGDAASFAGAVNDHGTVVGYSQTSDRIRRPVVWRHRRIHLLPTLGKLGPQRVNVASDINNHGVIVGSAATIRLHYVAVYWRHGSIHRLPKPANAKTATASQINERGSIVGYLHIPRRNTRAVRWTPQHRLTRLTRQVTPSGWVLRVAAAINDDGWIVGGGSFNGDQLSYLLRPAL